MAEHEVHPLRIRRPIAVWAVAGLGLAVLGIAIQTVFPSLLEIPGREGGIGFNLKPDTLFSVLGLPVTNTLLSSWLATVLIIALVLIARLLVGRGHRGLLLMIEIPSEYFWRFVAGVAGPRAATPLFALAASAILFILVNAWIATIPIYGTVTATTTEGHIIPLLRGAGTDINMPLALAVTAGLLVQAFGIYSLRLAYVERFVRVRGLLEGRFVSGAAEFVGGLFELFIEATRVLSFTFRLFGSLTAGEILILAIGFVAPVAVVVPFYGLELLIGAVQAWIFGSLLAVFAAAAMRPPDDGGQS